MTLHHIGKDTFHYKWGKAHKPALSVKPGDTVEFEINDVGSWQITSDWKSEDMRKFDNSKLYPLSGPVFIEGARPGDSLVVEVQEVRNGDFGWTSISPGFGVLDGFNEYYLYKWQLDNPRFARFEKGIKIPIRPFCGVMGVAPPEEGFFDVAPPGRHGGNLDVRHLTSGSRLELPVWVDGALFSVGDVHAAMGDGEVCISAIECAGTARLRFLLKEGSSPRWPRFYTKGDQRAKRGYYTATGIAGDLMEATKESVINMIEYLTDEYNLSREEAYVLCSVAADIRVHEVVDKPNWVVGTMIPLDCFP
ncbi:MAG TPA: acetamidase/formamidase family protein [Nitrososphaerales archaeon]|nr:acetamidase/formamidase family protein [Nitrososphaerales archaeon]HYB75757.1 acetamidase/formamidase family protein [Nitrososphaerales archaeon]